MVRFTPGSTLIGVLPNGLKVVRSVGTSTSSPGAATFRISNLSKILYWSFWGTSSGNTNPDYKVSISTTLPNAFTIDLGTSHTGVGYVEFLVIGV